MSHYAVAVFSDDCDFERLLAPYNEGDRAFFVKTHHEAEAIRMEFEKFHTQNPSWTWEMYLEEFRYEPDGDGFATWANPNAKWDYYTLDGKSYLFDTHKGADDEDSGFYRKNDYDWYPDNTDEYDAACKFWDSYIAPDDPDIQPPGIYNKTYYRMRFRTKEQYVKEASITVPYAFITPDGVWHAPGIVGWFAVSDDTVESWNKYVEEWDNWLASDSNPYVSLVDCHI